MCDRWKFQSIVVELVLTVKIFAIISSKYNFFGCNFSNLKLLKFILCVSRLDGCAVVCLQFWQISESDSSEFKAGSVSALRRVRGRFGLMCNAMVWAWRVGPANWIWMTEAGARGWWWELDPGRTHLSYSAPLTGWGRHRAQPHLFCYIWYQAPSQPPWHHNTRPEPCQLGLPGPRPQGRQGQAGQDLGPCQWPSGTDIITDWGAGGWIQRLVAGIGCLGVCQRCPHTLAVAVHLCRGQSEEAPAGEHSLMSTSIWAGELPWYLHRSAILWHNLTTLLVTINRTMFVQKSYNKLHVFYYFRDISNKTVSM